MTPPRDHVDLPTDPADRFPDKGRIAAVDFGSVRIGIAICDPDRILASPLEVRAAKDWKHDGDYYRGVKQREQLVGFVVGLPIHNDGGESPKSKESRQFARWLALQTDLPVRLFDERFTTVDAVSRMAGAGLSRKKKKNRVDAVAAQVILESFLESCRHRGQIVGESATRQSNRDNGDALE